MEKGFFKEILRGKKLRMSHPRLLVYQELSGAQKALSPQEIYHLLIRKGCKVGLTSIYRSLDLFESLGIAFKILNSSAVKYNLCQLEDHHHHVICKGCGHVMEIDFCDVSLSFEKVMEATGYVVTDHQLNYLGLCRECQS